MCTRPTLPFSALFFEAVALTEPGAKLAASKPQPSCKHTLTCHRWPSFLLGWQDPNSGPHTCLNSKFSYPQSHLSSPTGPHRQARVTKPPPLALPYNLIQYCIALEYCSIHNRLCDLAVSRHPSLRQVEPHKASASLSWMLLEVQSSQNQSQNTVFPAALGGGGLLSLLGRCTLWVTCLPVFV